ncbi:hypothetical protein COX08_01200 [Candidatus Beckwithbacteria bacterium CG23_combo_of_CG06-09_8_20_14_all_34_8]|uniref:Glycosyl transferase family 1 domain-containing protein n=1 Tax=Candidatus Beckwithbacteria bacterium CG23_combo_of_CG06-09_8_20_14_all_34_8 TaxID=1974497 RepID=A0A2H0B6Z0_9BACT|nr:MAG: hypothetical protein COX08_01200 [Candidatus Beckwithbacteria bacterium CG23_combo_of_CG06-09_8_20_14_all_34_8]
MIILLPVHFFTDDPKNGLQTEIWNNAKNLSLLGNKIIVVTVSSDLRYHTNISLAKIGIILYSCHAWKSHGFSPAESLLCFLYTFIIRLRNKFDWIYIIDEVPTLFSKYKFGAKLATRLITPKSKEVREIILSKDWQFDRSHKNEEESWQMAKPSVWHRLVGFAAYTIIPKFFNPLRLGENAELIFCLGKDNYKYFKSKFPQAKYLPNGVENDLIEEQKPVKRENKNRFQILFVGRIAKRKGIFYLLQAYKKVYKLNKNTELVIIGKGSEKLLQELVEKCGDLLNKNIYILGEKSHREVISYIKSCDLLVDPFIFAAFSNVALEAAYCKTPLIAPLHGGTKDFIIENQTGYLVDARNVSILSNKILDIINKYPEAKKIAGNAYKLVADKFTWKHIAIIINNSFNENSNLN